MTAITNENCSIFTGRLYVALELGWTSWSLGMSVGIGTPPRLRRMTARETETLLREIAQAKVKFGLPAEAPVICCYEAGRDGFWLARFLRANGIDILVVDSSSIEVNRRARRAKSDSLDVGKLLTMLIRHQNGEPHVWRVVRVPTVAVEDQRQLHREMIALNKESTRHVNRIKGLLASCGLAIVVDDALPERLAKLRQWDASPLPCDLRQRLLREHERWQGVQRQRRELDRLQVQRIRCDDTPQVDLVRRLMDLRGIGPKSAWLFVREFFGWREIRHRRELAALAGLTPTPYQSGDLDHEQGISKAGNRWMRTMLVEIAWCWLRYQPDSALSQWYMKRFGGGNSRQRKTGIVALARKLLVALWKYLKIGEIPVGAVMTDWETKIGGRVSAATPPAAEVAASGRDGLPPRANSKRGRQRKTRETPSAAPFDSAPGTALGSHLCGALSSAQAD
jgi:transposase